MTFKIIFSLAIKAFDFRCHAMNKAVFQTVAKAMRKEIIQIQEHIAPLRHQLFHHGLYSSIKSKADLAVFMEHHVYAVWDFMSLLKSLQQQLTCVSLPWVPVSDASTRYLINEIILGEECDVDLQGNRISHFELYLQAMTQCGANTSSICTLVEKVSAKTSLEQAFSSLPIPAAALDFMRFTFQIIHEHPAHVQAAVFTFGREDLIPGMFIAMINDMYLAEPGRLGTLKYYLERHIEVDGDQHSHLALDMTSALCGNDLNKWKEAEEAVCKALEMRIKLWDAIQMAIVKEAMLSV